MGQEINTPQRSAIFDISLALSGGLKDRELQPSVNGVGPFGRPSTEKPWPHSVVEDNSGAEPFLCPQQRRRQRS